MSVKYCPNCGKEYPPGRTFCINCAMRLPIEPPQPMYPAPAPVQQPQPIYQQPATAQQTPPQYQQQLYPPAYQPPPPLDFESQPQVNVIESVGTKGTRKSIILIAIGLAIALVISNVAWVSFGAQNSSEYNSLKSDLTELQSDLTELRQNHTSLERSYDNLQTDHSNLQQSYDALQTEHQMLQTEHQIFETFRLESTVEDFYETVRDTYSMHMPYGSHQDPVNYEADLARHDIGKFSWPSLETTYYDYYGTHSYDDAKAKLTYFLNIAEVNSSDTPITKIEKILEHVVSYIAYRPDMIDRLNSPWETLAFQSGDCDDFSTLTSALFELAGIDSAIEGAENSANDGHAMVLIHLDDLGSYGCYSYPDLTGYGLSAGKWIIIEPQKLIDNQDDSTWFPQWSINAAAEV